METRAADSFKRSRCVCGRGVFTTKYTACDQTAASISAYSVHCCMLRVMWGGNRNEIAKKQREILSLRISCMNEEY